MTATLFETVQQRVLDARAKVELLDVSDDVRRAVTARLTRLERASHTDLSLASRAVEEFHASLDAGVVPIYD